MLTRKVGQGYRKRQKKSGGSLLASAIFTNRGGNDNMNNVIVGNPVEISAVVSNESDSLQGRTRVEWNRHERRSRG